MDISKKKGSNSKELLKSLSPEEREKIIKEREESTKQMSSDESLDKDSRKVKKT